MTAWRRLEALVSTGREASLTAATYVGQVWSVRITVSAGSPSLKTDDVELPFTLTARWSAD